MPLIDLPDDVIHEICLHMWEHRVGAAWRKKFCDLSNTSKVSRRLHGIATPILYRRSARHAPNDLRLILLLRTLIQHPELAAHIKEAKLSVMINYSRIPLINDIIASLNIRPPEGWDEGWDEGEAPFHSQTDTDTDTDTDENHQEHIIAIQTKRIRLREIFLADLLLSSMKNLQHLSIHVQSDIKYGTHMLPSTDLSALHTLQLSGPNSVTNFRLGDYEDLCNKAPNLRELRVHMCMRTAADLPLENLTSMTFSSSIIRKGHLRRLLKTCKALQSFTFSLRDAQMIINHIRLYGPLATPGVMIQELSDFKSTLKHLTIWADHPILWNGEIQQDAFITSLEEFSALATLSLSENCLFKEGRTGDAAPRLRGNFLPASIEAVVLENISDGSRDIAEEIERQASSLQGLKNFHINMRSNE